MQVNLAERRISAGSLQDSQRETGILGTKILVSEPTKILRQEAEPRRPKSRQEFSPSSRWDSGREAKSQQTKSRRDPGGNPAKILPGFTAGSENSTAKISAGDPASAFGTKRNPSGQNLGRTRRESRWDPTKIPPRSRWLFYKGYTERRKLDCMTDISAGSDET